MRNGTERNEMTKPGEDETKAEPNPNLLSIMMSFTVCMSGRARVGPASPGRSLQL